MTKLTKEDLENLAVENLNLTRRAGKSTMQELLRLARLGMWAQEHLPAIKAVISDNDLQHEDFNGNLGQLEEALSKLPR